MCRSTVRKPERGFQTESLQNPGVEQIPHPRAANIHTYEAASHNCSLEIWQFLAVRCRRKRGDQDSKSGRLITPLWSIVLALIKQGLSLNDVSTEGSYQILEGRENH